MKSIHPIPASTLLCLLARTIAGLACTVLLGYAQSVYEAYTFTTIAGKAGSAGSTDGTNNAARLNNPGGVAVDPNGNIFVPERASHTIRKMTPVGTNWVVTTIAGRASVPGGADGTNSAARFNEPNALAVDSIGNLYVADLGNHSIRKLAPTGTNWVVTTLAGRAGSQGSADGTNSTARFKHPNGVAVDGAGNVYVSDWGNHTIRRLTPVGTDWVATTLAGKAGVAGGADGTNGDARFNGPNGLVVDRDGNLYVANELGSTIRKVTPVGTNWIVTTIAGRTGVSGDADGTGSVARFNIPSKIAMDNAGNLYVAEFINRTFRKLTPVGTNWVVTTLAGRPGVAGSADGTGSAASFNGPSGVAVDRAGNLYVSESSNFTIRKGFPALAIAAPGFSGGQFAFDLKGQAGSVVVVERSPDLVNWLPVWTNTLAGPLEFNELESGVHPNRFYRAQTK